MNEKPKRCIDAVLKRCDRCPYVIYPSWVDNYEDLSDDICCIYGYENDMPTPEEEKEFYDFMKRRRNNG